MASVSTSELTGDPCKRRRLNGRSFFGVLNGVFGSGEIERRRRFRGAGSAFILGSSRSRSLKASSTASEMFSLISFTISSKRIILLENFW